ncbi:MAG: ExbD/TolR family protein [Bacillota bacterium]
MKRRRMPESQVTHPNVTPLIDIVMCLIIFYMLVAKIGIKTGADKNIDLPASFQGLTLKDPGNTCTLNITAGGDQPLVTTLNPNTQQTEEVKIIDGAKKPLKAVLQLLKGRNDDFKVVIRADQNLDYRYLEPVLLTCSEVQIRDIRFATRKRELEAVAN